MKASVTPAISMSALRPVHSVALGLFLALAAPIFQPAAFARQKRKWPVSKKTAGQLRVNEWVKVEEHGAAHRRLPALAWLPAEKRFLLAAGFQGEWNVGPPFVYAEQHLSLADRLWKNRFPPGKNWKPEVGHCNAPPVRSRPFLKDGRVELFGNWGGGLPAFAFAVDTDRNALLVFTKDLWEYDCSKRFWRHPKPKGDPSGGARNGLSWGSLCYDAHNREFLLFGGSNGGSEFCDTRTWVYSPAANAWRRVKCGSARIESLRARAKSLRVEAVRLHAAHCNRYFKTELKENAGASLAAAAKKLRAGIEAFAKELRGPADGYEKTQRERAAAELTAARALAAKLGDAATPDSARTGLELTRVLWRAMAALLSEPPPRAHSQMVYDPGTRKIVLFGGDRLDMLYADTWTYDCRTRKWQEHRPKTSPSPRAGHAFLRLPESGKLVLLGGYGFGASGWPLWKQLPMQAWSYDVAGEKWTLVRDWGKAYPEFMRIGLFRFSPAAGAGDVVLALSREKSTTVTLACKLDAGRVDAAGQSRAGVRPGTVRWRDGGGYDPDWYLQGPVPGETAFQSRLRALPVNAWTEITGKDTRLPPRDRGWGTAVYDPDRQAIYVWGGGHSSHCGTDVPAFSMRTGRWHIKYPPAFPLEHNGRSGPTPLDVSFMGQPFVPVHSYHAYAYDPAARKMFGARRGGVYPYDPDSGLWKRGDFSNRFSCKTVLCSTPAGAYAWHESGKLFRHEAAKGAWTEVAVTGEKLPRPAWDAASMCYDSKRGRLLLISKGFKGNLTSVDLKTSVVRNLKPKGAGRIRPNRGYPKQGDQFTREVCYDEANDLMIVDSVGDTWPVYDCAKNAWVALKLRGHPNWSISSSLMYDPARKLPLAVFTKTCQVWALRLDPKSAGPRELK